MPKGQPVVYRTAFALYEAEDIIGEGGAGVVYRVHNEDGDLYALKLLRESDHRKLQRFKNEISFCQRSDHANILRIVETGVSDADKAPRPFYIMQLYGGTLRNLIRKGIAHGEILPLFDQLLSGVEAAHLLGTVHRDLKPENVLFEEAHHRLVVADFGIASFSQEDLYTAIETRDNERLANFCYAAPEQKERGRAIAVQADVFALGLILNEMFTGAVPNGTNFKRIGEISSGHAYLDSIVDRMLNQDPAKRQRSVRELKEELLARGNEFVALQKLSQKKAAVIPENTIEDPLIANPITINGTDYQNGYLVFLLSDRPNAPWIQAFTQPMRTYSSIKGYGPQNFDFSDKSMRVIAPLQEQFIPTILEHTKSYVKNANEAYKQKRVLEEQRRSEEQRKTRQAEMAEAERRVRILKMVQP